MKHFICVGLILAILVVEALSVELPSTFKICRRSMPNYKDCIAKSATEAIVSLAPGLRNFQILPIEPLEIDRATFGNTGGSISLKQSYKNIKIHGLTKGFRTSDWVIDLDKCVFACTTYNDRVDFVADYRVDGRILLLPITGNGRANITLSGLESTNTISCDKCEKDGETYLRVKKYTTKFSPAKVIFKFDNLFNGDKLLSDQTNTILNENSALIFKEYQASYEEIFGSIFAKLANDIFSRVPVTKIFPE